MTTSQQTQIDKEVRRLKRLPKKGLYTFLHHEIPLEPTHDLMERVNYILSDKPKDQILVRLRHIRVASKELNLLLDDYYAKRKLLADDYNTYMSVMRDDYYAKCKLLDDDYYAKRKPLDDDYNAKRKPLLEKLIPDCKWDGKTILG